MTDALKLPARMGFMRPFVRAGVLGEPEVHVAAAIDRAAGGVADEVALAAALCVRALRFGHTCVELDSVDVAVGVGLDEPVSSAPGFGGDSPTASGQLVWPETRVWASALEASEAVAVHDPATGVRLDAGQTHDLAPLVFDGRRVYLERYWRYERRVGDFLLSLVSEDALISEGAGDGGGATSACPLDDEAVVAAALDRYFAGEPSGPDRQREAARRALKGPFTVIAGGPGTGKTHTVALLLAAVQQIALDTGWRVEVACAAPTGKAAARMTEALRRAVSDKALTPALSEALLGLEASTLHRLLGYRDGVEFRHGRANPLRYDLVVVDETSMVDLALMAHLVDSLGARTRLVLVGDPYQLASVEAGAVLGDVVGPGPGGGDPPASPISQRIVVLDRVHRFVAGSAVERLADAVKARDADRAAGVLRDPLAGDVAWVDPTDSEGMARLRADVVAAASRVVSAARDGDAPAALRRCQETKVLCATRSGPLGSYSWSEHVETGLARAVGATRAARGWYVGRPVIVSENDYLAELFNGDTGVVVSDLGRGGSLSVAIPSNAGLRYLAPSQLAAVETWWAMTIHKSQGSEFDHVVVSLADASSRALSNELLYTAVTRAKTRVTVVASEEALRRAVLTPVARSTGLGERLRPRRSPGLSSAEDQARAERSGSG
jgi:exodeoxyribonuclease V alpha subunit